MQGTFTNLRGYGLLTQTPATLIQQLIQPFRGARTRIKVMKYTTTGTAHTILIRMPIGLTSVAVQALANQSTVILNAQPSPARNIANGDYLCFDRPDTTWSSPAAVGPAGIVTDFYKVNATPTVNAGNGQVTVTLSAALTFTIPAGTNLGSGIQQNAGNGGNCWLLSNNTDIIPGYNNTQPQLNAYATSNPQTNEWPTSALATDGIIQSLVNYAPLLIESNNITNQGTLEYVITEGHLPEPPRVS